MVQWLSSILNIFPSGSPVIGETAGGAIVQNDPFVIGGAGNGGGGLGTLLDPTSASQPDDSGLSFETWLEIAAILLFLFLIVALLQEVKGF